eukprot:scaffold22942_cov64-Phaeocystis_antarctica.AAC.10
MRVYQLEAQPDRAGAHDVARPHRAGVQLRAIRHEHQSLGGGLSGGVRQQVCDGHRSGLVDAAGAQGLAVDVAAAHNFERGRVDQPLHARPLAAGDHVVGAVDVHSVHPRRRDRLDVDHRGSVEHHSHVAKRTVQRSAIADAADVAGHGNVRVRRKVK